MKQYLIIISILLIEIGYAQNRNQKMTAAKITIQERVTQLFVATDQKNWEELKIVFSDQVDLDYSSMSNQPPVIQTPSEIINQWSGVLPGFDYTHHQIGNFLVEIEGNEANCFCYGTATHYLPNENGNVWTVVGSYNFKLKKEKQHWVITAMRFNFKYQSGNTELVGIAIENQKKK